LVRIEQFRRETVMPKVYVAEFRRRALVLADRPPVAGVDDILPK